MVRPDAEREAHTPQNLELNAHGMNLVRRLDIVDQLVNIDAPTLVSVGDVDPVTPVAAAEEIVRALPQGIGELDIVDGRPRALLARARRVRGVARERVKA